MKTLPTTDEWIAGLDLRHDIRPTIRGRARDVQHKSKLIQQHLEKQKCPPAKLIAQKIRDNEELSLAEREFVTRIPRGESKMKPINEEPAFLDAIQRQRLKECGNAVPKYIGRTYTMNGGMNRNGRRPSNGFTFPHSFIPSIALTERAPEMRRHMADIEIHKGALMLSGHFRWEDPINDEFVSCTDSPLFLLAHGWLRHLQGQGNCFFAWINRDRASGPMRWSKEQGDNEEASTPALFVSALELCDSFGVYSSEANKPMLSRLHPDTYTHEYLSHNVVEYPQDDVLQHVSLADYVDNGLLNLIPELRIPRGKKPAKLKTFLYYLRETLYKDTSLCTEDEINIARTLARLHTRSNPGEGKEGSRPNLRIFLAFLSLRRRASKDEAFQDRIRKLGYTLADLQELLHPNYERIYANLPENFAMMNLLRNVQAVVGGEPIKDDVSVDVFSAVPAARAYYPSEKNNPTVLHPFDDNSDYILNGRCGLTCDCDTWLLNLRKKRKRETTSDQTQDRDEESDDERREEERLEVAVYHMEVAVYHMNYQATTVQQQQRLEHYGSTQKMCSNGPAEEPERTVFAQLAPGYEKAILQGMTTRDEQETAQPILQLPSLGMLPQTGLKQKAYSGLDAENEQSRHTMHFARGSQHRLARLSEPALEEDDVNEHTREDDDSSRLPSVLMAGEETLASRADWCRRENHEGSHKLCETYLMKHY